MRQGTPLHLVGICFLFILLCPWGTAVSAPPFIEGHSAEIGPKGGTVRLDNGIELLIGPGAFKEPTVVRVLPSDGVPVRGGRHLYVQLGWAFRVEPSLKNARVNVRVPVSMTPEGFQSYLLKLDLNGPPICDREKCKGNFYMSCAIRDNYAWFDVSGLDEPNILQVAVRKPKRKRLPDSAEITAGEEAKPQPAESKAYEKAADSVQ